MSILNVFYPGNWPDILAQATASHSAPPAAPQPEIARDKIALGNQARRLLDDPVLQLAFQDAEAEAVRQWKGGKTPEARERAYHMHVALEEVKARLHSYLGNVKLFEAEQKQRERA